MRLNLDSLIYALPEDIDRAKKSGNFDELEKKLTERIANPKTTPMLRDRLIVEKELMGRWIRRYPYNHEEALKAIQKRVNGFTAEELELAAQAANAAQAIIRFWCAKEAVSKALGTGIRYSPREMLVTDYQADTGKLVIRLEGAWVDAFKAFKGRDIPVTSRVLRDHALASCFIPATMFDE